MGINKVQYGNTTLIDLTNDTVTPSVLMEGYTAHDRSGAVITGTATGGGTGAISVVDTTDTHGGTIRTITAVDISDTTAVASDVAQGKYFYTADGTKTAGTSTGGGGDTNPTALKKQINFIDYDGTIRYSYTSSEWASVTALPSNPSHSGLVSQGWNWTKAQIDAQLTAIPNGDVWVGQMYITESGDTEIDVAFFDSARLSPIMTICVNGTVEVDWGDNTTADTVTGTSLTTRLAVPHTYASAGSYMIKIHVVSGEFTFYGSTVYTLLRKNTTTNENKGYAYTIKAVRIGNGANIGTYAFYYCSSLASVTIPSTTTNIGTGAFQYCYSLASLTIPNGVIDINGSVFMYCNTLAKVAISGAVTTIAGSVFSSCYSLASLTIPNGVTSIGNGMISSTCLLASLIIPSTVTSIGSSAFSSCYGMAEYHFKSTTPPTLGTNAFNYIVSDCKIYVPSTSLEAYQTAENWSTYASYMVGE